MLIEMKLAGKSQH